MGTFLGTCVKGGFVLSNDKNFSRLVQDYKKALEDGRLQLTYEKLVKFVMALKAYGEKVYGRHYAFGSVSPGYLDFTYFPFADDFLRDQKLRFGIVLNHKTMAFELWLMGQNAGIQKRYWEVLKDSKWNEGIMVMPKYSVLETVLVSDPDFNQLDELKAEVVSKGIGVAETIVTFLKMEEKI